MRRAARPLDDEMAALRAADEPVVALGVAAGEHLVDPRAGGVDDDLRGPRRRRSLRREQRVAQRRSAAQDVAGRDDADGCDVVQRDAAGVGEVADGLDDEALRELDLRVGHE